MPAPTTVVDRLRAAGCVFAEDEAALLVEASAGPDELAGALERRCAGEPLEQVLGWADFAGLRIAVEPAVFVPRRRSEALVRLAIALAPQRRCTLVDLCCGTGALGLAVALATADCAVELHAADVDPVAVRCARRNLAPIGATVHLGDLFDALPHAVAGRVDVLIANAPYVPTSAVATLPPEARLHEPARALDGGPDGLEVHRRVATGAARWLAPGGVLLIETSERQAGTAAGLLDAAGLVADIVTDGEYDATVVTGRRPR